MVAKVVVVSFVFVFLRGYKFITQGVNKAAKMLRNNVSPGL